MIRYCATLLSVQYTFILQLHVGACRSSSSSSSPANSMYHENPHLYALPLHSSYFSRFTRTPYCCTYLKKQGSSAVKFRAPLFASNLKTFHLFCFLTWTFVCNSSPWPSFSVLRLLVRHSFWDTMTDLKNKIILVTGASAGIGLAAAETLARLGAIVIACARNIGKIQVRILKRKFHFRESFQCFFFRINWKKSVLVLKWRGRWNFLCRLKLVKF